EKAVETPIPSEATGESAIRDRVNQKVSEALNKPKAYLGVVTDITDSTIQIKTLESEIKQVSVAAEEITVVNSKGAANKAVKLTDIAIGDFIVAMGYINSNSVLVAQRILITDPVTEPKISAALGNVTDVTKKTLSVSGIKSSESSTISPDSKTTFESFQGGKVAKAKLADISQDDLIIYVNVSGESASVVRSIFIVAHSQG
ncbi:MAG: hypothetical protein HW376_1068, partial [candidate division NC10 bacterium]|nr:hypothetical protein [candidate division NC10 bacterium]